MSFDNKNMFLSVVLQLFCVERRTHVDEMRQDSSNDTTLKSNTMPHSDDAFQFQFLLHVQQPYTACTTVALASP